MPPHTHPWSDDEDQPSMLHGPRTRNQPQSTWNYVDRTNPPADLDNESISSGEIQDIPQRRQVISSSNRSQPTTGRSSSTTNTAVRTNSSSTTADHRFERNYTDRGHRQTVSPRGLSRDETRRRSRSPPRSGSPLFFPDEVVDESMFDLGPPRFRTAGTLFHRNLYDTSRTIDVNPYDNPYVDASQLNTGNSGNPYVDAGQFNMGNHDNPYIDASQLVARANGNPYVDASQLSTTNNGNPYVDVSQLNTTANHNPYVDASQIIMGNSRLHKRAKSLVDVQEEDVDTECTCPISYHCIHRAVDKLDCRPLVPKWKAFCNSLDEESYQTDKIVSAQPSGNPITSSRLSDIRQYCDRLERLPATSRVARENTYQEMHRWIQEVRESAITTELLQSSRIVPRLEQFLDVSNEPVRRAKGVTAWIEEELTMLLNKFLRGDLSFDPQRGLFRSQTMDVNNTNIKTTFKLDKSWEHYRTPQAYGNNGLVNGQLWYSREQLLRDGAHGARIGGIAGTTSGGAYSVVMGLHTKENKYADIDRGDVVDYEGTALPTTDDSKPSNQRDSDEDIGNHETGKDATRSTKIMMTSLKNGKPIRMFRSFRLAKIVKHKPIKGYRYDGLYKVTKQKLQNKERQIYSFTMVREPGQGPIRDIALSQNNETNSAAPIPDANQERPGWASSVKRAGDKKRKGKDVGEKANKNKKKK